MKKHFTLCLLLIACCFSATANDTTKIDTVRTILTITNSKLNKPQPVPGYVLVQNGKVIGYLNRVKKPHPKKVEVWAH